MQSDMDKVLLITGGGRGIGAATARLAVAAGYRVAINYMSDSKAADALAAELKSSGAKVITIKADVSKLDDVIRMFDETENAFGPVSALVNNAGITGLSSRLDEADPQTIIDTIAINVNGTIFAAREAVKRMSTRHGAKGGVIVNVSSGASTIGSPGEYTWYAASKGAVDSFTLGLGREVAEEGIRVVAVAPGLTETEIHARSTGEPGRVKRLTPMIPMKRAGAAEEVAQTIMFALSDAASYITATTIRVSGGR
jgi:NAD(P)-dependent dehydrogenase (short-subunit alcohol dehydrogenase family)